VTELVALLDGREVGSVHEERGRARFVYADSWRDAPGAYPLSLSMPLMAAEHGSAATESFLWGLLPDNDIILRRWAQRLQVSARSPVALLGHVGEDCTGAVQFLRAERREQLSNTMSGDVAWLSEADIAARLRALLSDASAWRAADDAGQFSLAGAQPKTALLFDGRRWGVPSGRTPTTHILKPPMGRLDGHAENEHLCLALARALGLPTAKSEVREFDGVSAIVVERYDRIRNANADSVLFYRVHQEDFCQALGVHPAKKYQNEGGPGPRQIVEQLRSNTAGEQDIATFLDALIFNALIGGTDGHAKNYSLLIGGNGLVRLAPLYDIASALVYPGLDPEKARLAMKVGNKYRLRDIGVADWRKLAANVRVDVDRLVLRVRAMATELPDRLADEVRTMRKAGLTHAIIGRMVVALTKQAARLGRV
jgi:serine/threonine-protein kinase HipA